MSILGGGEQASTEQEEQPQERTPNLGRLKANPRARGRRDKVKFFDSADWAMKSQQGDQQQDNPLPPSLASYTEQGNKKDDGSSLLANNDSPIVG
ncbi:hypothetical protein GPJ56_009141 [Histomonas meleagridis]|uniref:uncharacterized protein n=1 Tax=Histomonas meleagridis TaxID=135588 RepID=UPI00355A8A53|nr:hypothetical protein GPJ56_009141 [Histomonas meleagridis]KAH0799202.1 hypothetical protein GO595_007999 [Histomonas meleagridis]